jgi:hypothetical protein
MLRHSVRQFRVDGLSLKKSNFYGHPIIHVVSSPLSAFLPALVPT